MQLDAKCRPIELILSDVDGVLTDGTLVFDNQGTEIKRFHIRDGLGVRLWQRAGYRFGLITGRNSQIVKVRAEELGVEIVRQGVDNKLPVAKEILNQLQLDMQQLCYVGDDLPDIPLIRAAGLGIAVSDAADEVRDCADYITQVAGGRGAAREVVELILRNQRRWDDLVQRFFSP